MPPLDSDMYVQLTTTNNGIINAEFLKLWQYKILSGMTPANRVIENVQVGECQIYNSKYNIRQLFILIVGNIHASDSSRIRKSE